MSSKLFNLALVTATTLFGTQAFAQNARSPVSAVVLDYPFPQIIYLPPFPLASTETAQVNLTNVAIGPGVGWVVAVVPSCTGTVAFFNAAGTMLGTATTYKIASGVTSSFSLPFASAELIGTHGILRAVVTPTFTPGLLCSLVTSLQTTDTSSGVTHLFVPGIQTVGYPIYGGLSPFPILAPAVPAN